MARTPTFSNRTKLVETLNSIKNGEDVSRFLCLQLVDLGYVTTETEKHAGRGRPMIHYVLSGKGRGYLALAKNWGTKLEYLRQNTRPVAPRGWDSIDAGIDTHIDTGVAA
jgi:hypothetical protein